MPQSPRVAVILAGGSGERFWPLSTPDRPKQLLKLCSPTETLLEEAVSRAAPLFAREDIYLATGQRIGPSLRDAGILDRENVLIEPEPRNTLGALCWAVAHLRVKGYSDDTTMAVLTTDHAIGEPDLFRKTLVSAMELADSTEGLVAIGIRPTRAETGYGYIHPGDTVTGGFRVKRFVEKPDGETAAQYVADGYLWNSGMYFWRLGAFVSELRAHVPEAAAVLDQIVADPDKFREVPSVAVDRAVMERSSKIYVVPGTFPWDDVGAWDALSRTRELGENGNVEVGAVASLDSSDCIVHSEGIPVGLIGVQDLIVVATPTGVLVCHKSQAQRVREVVAQLAPKN